MCVVDLCNCDYLSDVVMVINRMWTSDPNAHAICDDVRRPFNDRIERKKGMFSFVHMHSFPPCYFISLEKDETNEYLEKTVCVNISLYTVFALASMFIWSKIKSYVNAKGYFFLCT